MARPGGGGGDIMAAFRAATRAHPDRPAIIHDGTPIPYVELASRVDELAGRLAALSVGKGVVGVYATHAPETVTALLAVWAAGGAYCPLDPAFPETRRSAMLSAAGCRLLFDPRLATLQPLPPAPSAPTGPGLAYTLFTSGSTGEPKAVLTPHRAIGPVVTSLRELFELTPADRVLQFASLNWDTCFEEILPTLATGAALVFHPDAHAGSFPRFLRMVACEEITVLDLPTAFWHELVTYLVEEGGPLPATVRLVVIGGEAASPARLADWRALPTGHARLVNTYGSTETTLITHAVDLHGPRAARAASSGAWVPIGRALPHVVELIADDGELLIGGPAIASGYHARPELTAARFVTIDGSRFFRTGDRVRRGDDGMLVPQGRLDGEIKIRGVRVDPAEVEAHIAMHPSVRAVAVVGTPVADHTVLAAYVVARPDTETTGLAEHIRDDLCSRLPAHLIPSHIRVVRELVYTASGKVDRNRITEVLV